jgi:hypothetical protein
MSINSIDEVYPGKKTDAQQVESALRRASNNPEFPTRDSSGIATSSLNSSARS